MTAITTIRLNKWECVKTSSYSDQTGPNEIKMPINPVLIAVVRSQENTEICTCRWKKTGPAVLSRIQTAEHWEHIYIMIMMMMMAIWIMMIISVYIRAAYFWMMTSHKWSLAVLPLIWATQRWFPFSRERLSQSQTDICIKLGGRRWPLMIQTVGQIASLNSASEPKVLIWHCTVGDLIKAITAVVKFITYMSAMTNSINHRINSCSTILAAPFCSAPMPSCSFFLYVL